jgi:hypothetical protein
VTPAEALAAIQGYAGANRIRIESHARKRMKQRGARYEDVRCALMTASRCDLQDNDRWKLPGTDTDGDELTCIVVIEDEAVVVTIF